MKPNDKMKTIGKRFGVDFGKDNDTEVYDFLVKKGFAGLANIFFDDRNQVVEMWRDQGLTCLQVADGDF